MSSDSLLDAVFDDLETWEKAIQDGADKKIRQDILENFSDPDYRAEIKNLIATRKYIIKPPHEAKIPKDDGTMRTVYVNEGRDRILFTVFNNIFFKKCPDMIHSRCVSYQSGIGCGKIDKRVVQDILAIQEHITNSTDNYLGYKIDLSKYFDSVPIEYIDKAFDDLEQRLGKSAVIDLVREYYHDDRLLTLDKQIIHKYTSLRQGCAIASFLADCVLRDIDEIISNMNVVYYRYSDDILILGPNADTAFAKISKMLDARSLALNPKKVEKLDKSHWFVFLGFSIKNDKITLSKKRIKNLQHEIELRTIKMRKTNPDTALRKIYLYLYDNSITKYGYADGILPIINSISDMRELDKFILDCLRACGSHKKHVGGLGYDKTGRDGVILRGKGRNVKKNLEKIPSVENYIPITYMRELYISNRDVYNAYVKEMMFKPLPKITQ